MRGLPLLTLLFSFFLLIPFSAAVGIGPGTVTLDYNPGATETVQMIALNNNPSPATFSVSGSQSYIQCSPGLLTVEPGSQVQFSCTITIPATPLPPGVHEIGRVRVSETAPQEGTVAGIAAVESIIRVNVPNEGPYLGLGITVQNVRQGQQAKAEISTNNIGTDALGALEGTVWVVNQQGAIAVQSIPFAVAPLNVKESGQYEIFLATTTLPSGGYRAIAEVPYADKKAHTEAEFKIGEMRIAIGNLQVEPIVPGGIAKLALDLESFWGESITATIDAIILDKGHEIGRVADRVEQFNGWQRKQTTIFWETGTVAAGTYDVRILLKYGGRQEQRDFAQALVIGKGAVGAKGNFRQIALVLIGIMIIILLAILIILLKKRGGKNA